MKFFAVATIVAILLSVLPTNYRPKISTDIAKVLLTGSVEVNPTPSPEGPHPDVDKCICKGTGIIVQGDGHESKCPYHGKNEETGCTKNTCTGKCGDNCRCRSGQTCTPPEIKPTIKVDGKIRLIANTVEKKEEVDYHLYYFGAAWCGPCRRMKAYVWNKKNNDLYNLLKDRNIKLTKLDWDTKDHRELFNKYQVRTLPQTILVKKDTTKKLVHYTGYVDRNILLKKIKDNTNEQ